MRRGGKGMYWGAKRDKVVLTQRWETMGGKREEREAKEGIRDSGRTREGIRERRET